MKRFTIYKGSFSVCFFSFLVRVWSRVCCGIRSCRRSRSSSSSSSSGSSNSGVRPPLLRRRRPRPRRHRRVEGGDRPQPHRNGAREPHSDHGQRGPPSLAVEVLVPGGGAPRGREREADRAPREAVGRPPRGRGLQVSPPARGEGEEGLLGAGAVAVVEGLSRSQEVDRLRKEVLVVVVVWCFLDFGEVSFFSFFLFFSLTPANNIKLFTHRERPDAKPLRQDPLLRRVDRRDADDDARVRVVREVVVVVVEAVVLGKASSSTSSSSSSSSSPPSAFVVAKLVAARAVGEGLALLPGGLAAGLVGEALRESPPGGLELAAVGAPRGLWGDFLKGFFRFI